jgi:hypothetical protein
LSREKCEIPGKIPLRCFAQREYWNDELTGEKINLFFSAFDEYYSNVSSFHGG